jgi:hypothetical protein
VCFEIGRPIGHFKHWVCPNLPLSPHNQQQPIRTTASCTTASNFGMAAPPPASSCCQHCGAPDILLDIYENFCLLVCSSCFRRHENYISKSNAKSGYLLSDGDLYPLRYVEKENPRNSKFAQMKQYLVSQVLGDLVACCKKAHGVPQPPPAPHAVWLLLPNAGGASGDLQAWQPRCP